VTVLRTAYCLFTEKSLVRDLSIGLGTSNHLAKQGNPTHLPNLFFRGSATQSSIE